MLEVQTRENHYQFQCHNFTEKDSWKKAFEHMRQNAESSCIPKKPDTSKETMMRACVNVTLLEAKGLTRHDSALMGGASDPYCKIVVDQKVFTSSVKSNTLTPTWNETFSLYVPNCVCVCVFPNLDLILHALCSEVTELPIEMLLVMYDHDKLTNDDVMGYIPYIVQSAGERADTNREWFDLRSAKLYEKAQGKVQLSVQCRFDAETQNRVTFGVRLNELMARDSHRDLIVPDIAYKCIRALDQRGTKVKGIFRVPGSREKMDMYERMFDFHGMETDFSPKDDVHLIASMLKLFLRCLPEPVICYSAYDDLIKAAAATSSSDDDDGATERSRKIKQILHSQLPEENMRLLKTVCCLLKKITDNAETTLMKVSNIAIVFSAVFLSAPPEAKSTKTDLLQHLPLLNSIVECIISNYNYIFDVKRRACPIRDMCARNNLLSQPEEQVSDDDHDGNNGEDGSSDIDPTQGSDEMNNGEPQAQDSGNAINWAAIARIAHEKIARDKKAAQGPSSPSQKTSAQSPSASRRK